MKEMSEEEKAKQLRKLKGVGEALSRRLVEAGLDSFGKIALAGETAVLGLKGINPRLVVSIVAQASELAEDVPDDGTRKVEELRRRSACVRERVQALVINARDRFTEQATGPDARKVEKELVKIIESLDRVEGKLGKKKKAGKCLTKAEQHLATLAEAGLKEFGRKLKKARKTLEKVYA